MTRQVWALRNLGAAAAAAPRLRSAHTWRVIDALVALLMTVVGLQLLLQPL